MIIYEFAITTIKMHRFDPVSKKKKEKKGKYPYISFKSRRFDIPWPLFLSQSNLLRLQTQSRVLFSSL
jgi:hypothetical protein